MLLSEHSAWMILWKFEGRGTKTKLLSNSPKTTSPNHKSKG
jgi:hypothetical protein